MQNLTEQGKIRVSGCQSCLVKPSCKGTLQLPNAGLFLTPDPLRVFKNPVILYEYYPLPCCVTCSKD